MASLHEDQRNGIWILMFRYGGKQFRRSTETKQRKTAEQIKARVEETLHLLKQGRIQIAETADPALWIMTGGALSQKPTLKSDTPTTLPDIIAEYLECQLSKASSTQYTESIHCQHLQDFFPTTQLLKQIQLADLQRYVEHRRGQSFRGRPISGTTIRKEVTTFRQIWNWAVTRKIVDSPCPVYGAQGRWAVEIPKPIEKEKFLTWTQIEDKLKHLPDSETPNHRHELWERLFLDEEQITGLLDHIQEHARHDFIYPMSVFLAYTGARRGELCRCQVDDCDFQSEQIKIRERKRKRDVAESVRFVPFHSRLQEVLKVWLENHSGISALFYVPLKMRTVQRSEYSPLTVLQAYHHFEKTLEGSKWEVVRGFHVLRHSFGSNLARSGRVPRETIAAWMGHTTQEMMEHYQHLFPQDGKSQIEVLK